MFFSFLVLSFIFGHGYRRRDGSSKDGEISEMSFLRKRWAIAAQPLRKGNSCEEFRSSEGNVDRFVCLVL